MFLTTVYTLIHLACGAPIDGHVECRPAVVRGIASRALCNEAAGSLAFSMPRRPAARSARRASPPPPTRRPEP